MPLNDDDKRWLREHLSTHQPRDVWVLRNPFTDESYGYMSRFTRTAVGALLDAQEGLDTQAILDRIDRRADEKLAVLEDIAGLVADRDSQDAEQVVDAIADRLGR